MTEQRTDDDYKEVCQLAIDIESLVGSGAAVTQRQPLAFEFSSSAVSAKLNLMYLDLIMGILVKSNKLEQELKYEKSLKLLQELMVTLQKDPATVDSIQRILGKVYERMGLLSRKVNDWTNALEYFQKHLEISTTQQVHFT